MVMKVTGLMLSDSVISKVLSSILIVVDLCRKPEEITIQHIGFRKLKSLWFLFFTGRNMHRGKVRPGRAVRRVPSRPNRAIIWI